MKITSVLSFVFMLWGTYTSAQVPFQDLIFGVHNPQPSVYHFCSINRTTGVVTDMQQLPISFYGGLASLTVDPVIQRIVFNSATTIYLLDPAGVAPMSTITPPLPQGAFLGCLEREPCSGVYYGFLLLNDGTRWFVAYDLTSNAMTTLSQIEGLNGFSEMSYINAAHGTYVIEHAHQVMVIDLDDGAVLSNLPNVTPEGYSFRGIVYHCASDRTFGTIASQITGTQKWLGELDITTGDVSFISEAATTSGFYKPSSAGACIVQDEGLYIWEGTGGIYVSSNILDGLFEADLYATSTAVVHDIVHYSTCACPVTTYSSFSEESDPSKPFPNPTNGLVSLYETDKGERSPLTRWVDPLGRVLPLVPEVQKGDMKSWDLSGHPKGVYTLIWSDGHTHRTWRVVYR